MKLLISPKRQSSVEWRVLVSLLALILLSPSQAAQFVPPVVVFDEDDPLGIDYYDASIGGFSAPSFLRLTATSADKLPVTSPAASGKAAALLEWKSLPGGDWKVLLFNLGFAAKDVRQHDHLLLELNSPGKIRSDALPLLALESGEGRLSGAVHLDKFVDLDADPATWHTARIPLSAFGGEADLRRVRAIQFRQGKPDASLHTLWIDNVRFEKTGQQQSEKAPDAPQNLVARSGDRSMTLNWPATPNASGYRVFRSAGQADDFQPVGEVLKTASFSDTAIENGRVYRYKVKARGVLHESEFSNTVVVEPKAFGSDDAFLDYVQQTAFDYFWFETNPKTGMIRDRSQPWSAASVAALGFGLTGLCIGVDHGWITREAGAERVLTTLRTLWNTKQGPESHGTSGYKGWFYHFLETDAGERFGSSELSSIDTALLLGGVLDARNYFNRAGLEQEIRDLAQKIYDRVDWRWMLNGEDTLTMGWYPESGFIKARWNGYNEASILYILGLGAGERNRLDLKHWQAWTSSYSWATSFGQSFIHFPPLFGHQYSALWIDFRDIADDYTRARGITYFENSRRATLAQRAYAIANPLKHAGYSSNQWGFTACDGPGSAGFLSYSARGTPPPENDDGTIAPTAAGGSLPFAPEECIAALRYMYDTHRTNIWCGYGFRDAFNLTANWWGADVLGIDQGPILIMAENLRTEKIWKRMKKEEILQRGLARAGFK